MFILTKMINDNKRHKHLISIVKERLISNKLYDIVRSEEYFTMTKIHYRTQRPIDGEIDLYAVKRGKKNYLLLFEVKCIDSQKGFITANRQLGKDTEHYSQLYKADKVWKFYINGLPDINRGDEDKYKIRKV